MAFVASSFVKPGAPALNQRAACRSSPGPAGRRAAARSPRCRRGVVAMSSDITEPIFKIFNEAAHSAWVESYKGYVSRNGERACRMALDGYHKFGRGAVFVLDKPGLNIGVATPTGVEQGIMSMYVSMEDVEKRSDASTMEMEPIMNRMRLYDPLKQFCVVYETGGMQGADIVTPKKMPEKHAKAA